MKEVYYSLKVCDVDGKINFPTLKISKDWIKKYRYLPDDIISLVKVTIIQENINIKDLNIE